MANKITGSTDITGALQVNARMLKSILLVGAGVAGTKVNTILNIAGTSDATTYFGDNSPFVEITRVLIQNGADYIKGICTRTPETEETEADTYAEALTVSLQDNTIKCVIVDILSATVNTAIKSHLNEAESNDMFRYGVIGGEVGIDTADLIALATTVADKRIFCAGPNVVDSANNEKSGIFAAAGVAANIMSQTSDPALPMNNVGINGYFGVSKNLLFSERNNLANGGVVALYPDGGLPTIHRLVTTYTTDPVWQEGTTIFIADDVLESVMNRLKANYRRTKNVARILEAIRQDVINVLQDKDGLEIIQNFDKETVSVIKDPEDIYGALVDYEFQVVTPLYTITIKQHMKI